VDNDFSIETVDDDRGRWLRVHGDLDDAAAPALIKAAGDSPPERGVMVVDLSGCAFLDSGGVRALVAIAEHHVRLSVVVVAPSGSPARLVIDIVGLAEAVPVVERAGDVGDGPPPRAS
jgi:anti-anti-sigma factor